MGCSGFLDHALLRDRRERAFGGGFTTPVACPAPPRCVPLPFFELPPIRTLRIWSGASILQAREQNMQSGWRETLQLLQRLSYTEFEVLGSLGCSKIARFWLI